MEETVHYSEIIMGEDVSDIYYTLGGDAETAGRERSSKFLAFAYHVRSEEDIKNRLEPLRRKYYDATHHCYAWRLGPKGENFRANDDGEPSGTAGKPILGQLLSRELTDTLVVVVRYFGGTKLGVSGLINAYRESASMVLQEAKIESRTVDAILEITFGFEAMNDVMRIVKEMQPRVVSQNFDNLCSIELAIRKSREEVLTERFSKLEGVNVEHEGYR